MGAPLFRTKDELGMQMKPREAMASRGVLETVRNEGNSLRYGDFSGAAVSSAVEMHMIVSGG